MMRLASILILFIVLAFGSCTDTATSPVSSTSFAEVNGSWVGISTYIQKKYSYGGVAFRSVRIDEPVQLILFDGWLTMFSEDRLVFSGDYILSPGHILITPTNSVYTGNPALFMSGEYEYSVIPQPDGCLPLVLDKIELEFSDFPGVIDTTWRSVWLYPEWEYDPVY
jgi:hypothetical protein